MNSIYNNQQQQQQYNNYQQQKQNLPQLYMGELDPWWDEMAIRSVWSAFGFNNINVKLIREKLQQSGANNSGYCFIEFPNLEMANNALALNGSKIPNSTRVLKLNKASGGQYPGNNGSSTGGPSQQSNRNEFSIFVGDLAPEVTEQMLFELFGTKYASVTSTKIMTDPMTGNSKGYGFVRFSTEQDQERSMTEMQGVVLAGRPLRVSNAVPKQRQQQHGQFPRGPQHQFQHHSQQTQQPLPNETNQQILSSFDNQYQPPLNQFTDPNNTTVFIGGLSSVVSEDELRLYFQPFGDITYVKIPVGKGCGFVQYTTRASAELAISKMQGYPIAQSRVRLSWGRSSANPKPQQYVPQQDLPVLYGYSNQISQPPQFTQYGVMPQQQFQHQHPAIAGGAYGNQDIQSGNTFSTDSSETPDQSRLNELYLAARDGRLDTIDSGSNGFVF